jgi:hypothetical protein
VASRVQSAGKDVYESADGVEGWVEFIGGDGDYGGAIVADDGDFGAGFRGRFQGVVAVSKTIIQSIYKMPDLQ